MRTSGDGYDVRTLAAGYRAGITLAPHRHEWGQLVFAASGVMRVITDDAAWLIPPTRAIVRHAIVMQGEVAMRTLYIDMSRASPLPTSPYVLAIAPLLRELVLHILRIGMLASERIEHDRIAGLFVDLILSADQENLVLPLPGDGRARRLAEHWQQYHADQRDLSELAKHTGASFRTLQRLFRRETGLTVKAWRQRSRLIQTVAKLAAGATVTDAALGCGYNSISAFGAAFVRQFGASSTQYITKSRHLDE